MVTTLSSVWCRLAVFDVAGTTVLDGDAVVDCLRAAVQPYVETSVEDAYAVMGLPKPEAIAALLMSHRSWSPQDLVRAVGLAHADFRAAIVDRYSAGDGIAPADGALRVFDALRQADIRIALDTGFDRVILDALMATLGWADGVVDVTVASDEVEHGRPHPDMVHRAMALTGVADSSAVVKVGDTVVDVEEGLAAGCGLVVGVTYGTHTRGQLERTGVVVLDELEALLPLLGLERR